MRSTSIRLEPDSASKPEIKKILNSVAHQEKDEIENKKTSLDNFISKHTDTTIRLSTIL